MNEFEFFKINDDGDYIFNFGKYKYKKLDSVIDLNMDYVYWSFTRDNIAYQIDNKLWEYVDPYLEDYAEYLKCNGYMKKYDALLNINKKRELRKLDDEFFNFENENENDENTEGNVTMWPSVKEMKKHLNGLFDYEE